MKSDPELLLDFSAGDESAFEKLLGRHRLGVLNFFYRMVWDKAVAEDLTQEVFLRVLTHAGGYQPQAQFSTYLYRIARNCWIDHCRRHKGERGHSSLDADQPNGAPIRELLSRREENPLDTRHKEEVTNVLVDAIDGLPEEQKMVFLLSEVEGMPYQEISQTLSVPVGTVKSRMFHAIRRLRDQLAREVRGARHLVGQPQPQPQ